MLAVAPLGNAMLAGYHTGGAPLFALWHEVTADST